MACACALLFLRVCLAQFGSKEGIAQQLRDTRHITGVWAREDNAAELSLSFTNTEICALTKSASPNLTEAAHKCGCGVFQSSDGSYRPNCSSSPELKEIELGQECGVGGNPDDQRFHDCGDWQEALLRWKSDHATNGLKDIESLVRRLVRGGIREILFVGDSVMKQTVAAFICAAKRANRLLRNDLFTSIATLDVTSRAKNITGVLDISQRMRLHKLKRDGLLTSLYALNLNTTVQPNQILVIFSNYIPSGGLARLAQANLDLAARIEWGEGGPGALLILNQGLHWHRNYCGDESRHVEVKYRLKMTQVLKRMQQMMTKRWAENGGAQKHMVALFQQTSAQHFGSIDGDYDTLSTFMGSSCRAADKGKDTGADAKDESGATWPLPECDHASETTPLLRRLDVPASAPADAHGLCSLACAKQQNSRLWRRQLCTCLSRNLGCHKIVTAPPFSQNWRNVVVDQILKSEKLDQVHLIPFHDFTIRRGKAHVMLRPGERLGNPDCTHYCYSPYLWEPLWSSYRFAVENEIP